MTNETSSDLNDTSANGNTNTYISKWNSVA